MNDIKKDYKTHDVIEQECTFDGQFRLPISAVLLMDIINGMSARDDDEISEMIDPRKIIVRVIIQTKER